MNPIDLMHLLQQVSEGRIEIEAAFHQLNAFPHSREKETGMQISSDDLCLDLERKERCGFPEAIYAPGKSPELIIEAFDTLHRKGDHALATRASLDQMESVRAHFPDVIVNQEARTLRLMVQQGKQDHQQMESQKNLKPCIVTAGTTDRPVAEEAAETLRWMQYEPSLFFDAGVAGPHRLLKHVERLQQAGVIIVVAGMEGALPSIVGGWVSCPVIAVPTSVGYGANFGGVSALLSMLNSCAANVCTVNIDAGFKAGYLAGLMTWRSASKT